MKKTIWKSEVRFFQFSLWWLAFIPCLFVFAWNLGLACITDFIKLGHIDFSNISVIDNAMNTCKYYLAFIGVIYVILSFFMLFLNGLRDKINGIVDYVFTKLPMWDNDAKSYPINGNEYNEMFDDDRCSWTSPISIHAIGNDDF